MLTKPDRNHVTSVASIYISVVYSDCAYNLVLLLQLTPCSSSFLYQVDDTPNYSSSHHLRRFRYFLHEVPQSEFPRSPAHLRTIR